MGCLISAHFLEHEPTLVSVRAALPPSLACRAYRHRSLRLFAIDTYRAAKPPRVPFLAATPATDLPLELPESLSSLTVTYRRLVEEGVANGLKRAYINLSSLLSDVLRQRVLTIYSDDDGNDFACLTESGVLVSLIAQCGEYVVRFQHGGQAVLEPGSENRRLHALASEHLQTCFGIDGTELGLGSFDAPEAHGFVELATLSQV
jgi:hypothetical protein